MPSHNRDFDRLLIQRAREQFEAGPASGSGEKPLFQERYALKGLLGRGGFAEVYQALDTKLGRTVAIKITPKTVLDDPSTRKRFEQEIKATAALSHPHVVTIHDANITPDGAGYLDMEYMAGGTVKQAVSEDGPFEWQRFVEIAVGLADGMERIHGAGFVHRDIKPENILFWAANRELAKLADLGIAHLSNTDATAITQPGAQPGTLLWMAPEQLAGEDPRPESDIYSLGATFYFMLSGRFYKRVPADLNVLGLIRALPALSIIPLEESGRPIPPQLVKVVHRCLEREPAKRFSSAGKLREALSAVTAASSSRGTRQVPSASSVRETESPARRALAVPKPARVSTLHDAIKVGDLAATTKFATSRSWFGKNTAVNRVDDGDMPLHCAINSAVSSRIQLSGDGRRKAVIREGPYPEIIKVLLENGADPDALDKNGFTPLLLAASVGFASAVELLVDNEADLDVRTPDGNDPLHLGALDGANDVIDILLNAGMDVDEKNATGNTPLNIAASRSHPDAVALLLKRGANPNIPDQDRCYPLHSAAYNNDEAMASALLANGANPTVYNNRGLTPSDEAIAHGKMGMAAVLRQALARYRQARQ